jgi:hypothetical protein
MAYLQGPKRNPRQEYRLKQREQIEGSPSIAKKFPRLKGLTVTLEFFDAAGTTKQGEVKCKLNVEHAKSVLWFACPGVECICGDFDLSAALSEAVAKRSKVAEGELRCGGTRKRGDRELVACKTLLRYKFNLNYDRNKGEKGRTGRASDSAAQEEAGPGADATNGARTSAV